MNIRVVWLIQARFEREWLWSLLAGPDVQIEEHADTDTNKIYPPGSIFIINSSVDYEAYFEKYEQAGIEYAAIHLSDEYYKDSCRFYDHDACLWVARNYWHPALSKRSKVLTFGLGWKNGYMEAAAQVAPPPANWKDRPITVSFAGNIHHTFRRDFVQMFATVEPNKFHLTYDGFDSKNGLDIVSYRSLMNQSKYVLCPIGHCNIDCFRIYEALEAGAVPITLSATNIQRWLYWDALLGCAVPWIAQTSIENCYNELQKQLENGEAPGDETAQVWLAAKQKWAREFRSKIEEMQNAK